MGEVTIREIRNHGGHVVDRVEAGESMTITRDGKPVATLSPLEPPTVPLSLLLERWVTLPPMDPRSLRRDIDELIDPYL